MIAFVLALMNFLLRTSVVDINRHFVEYANDEMKKFSGHGINYLLLAQLTTGFNCITSDLFIELIRPKILKNFMKIKRFNIVEFQMKTLIKFKSFETFALGFF